PASHAPTLAVLPLSLHDALPIFGAPRGLFLARGLEPLGQPVLRVLDLDHADLAQLASRDHSARLTHHRVAGVVVRHREDLPALLDRKSTRLNSSHRTISYAVFCL